MRRPYIRFASIGSGAKIPGLAAAVAALSVIAGGAAHAGLASPYPIVPVAEAAVYTFDSTDVPDAPCAAGCQLGSGGMLAGGSGGFGYTASGNGGDPSISATGTGGYISPGPGVIGNGIQPNGGAVELSYYYSVSGPANTYVPVTITGNLSTSASGAYASIAYVRYGNGGFDTLGAGVGSLVIETNQQDPSLANPVNAVLNTNYEVLTNTQLKIDLYASALVVARAGGQAATDVDPRLSLGSASLQAGDFITLSSNIAGVPEPSVWTLMFVGFGSVGAAMRRSRGEGFLRPGMVHRIRAISRRISASRASGLAT